MDNNQHSDNNWKTELMYFVINFFISAVAAASVFLSEFHSFAPAVFFIVFLLYKISDQLYYVDLKNQKQGDK